MTLLYTLSSTLKQELNFKKKEFETLFGYFLSVRRFL